MALRPAVAVRATMASSSAVACVGRERLREVEVRDGGDPHAAQLALEAQLDQIDGRGRVGGHRVGTRARVRRRIGSSSGGVEHPAPVGGALRIGRVDRVVGAGPQPQRGAQRAGQDEEGAQRADRATGHAAT
jgi:hypothetical protein